MFKRQPMYTFTRVPHRILQQSHTHTRTHQHSIPIARSRMLVSMTTSYRPYDRVFVCQFSKTLYYNNFQYLKCQYTECPRCIHNSTIHICTSHVVSVWALTLSNRNEMEKKILFSMYTVKLYNRWHADRL